MKIELQTQHDRSALRLERQLTHRPEKVWRALTEPAHLNQWFPFHVEIELMRGGKINFIDPNSQELSSDGVVTECEPLQVLAFRWGDDLLHWELQPNAAGCLLVFTHTFADHAGAASFASGWHVCLDAMASVLDGNPINPAEHSGPAWKQYINELHESYIDALQLNRGSAELTASGWQVRFERQLTQPIDKVWAALVAEAEVPLVGELPPSGFTVAAIDAGPVTAVEAPTLLEYEWRHANGAQGQVRWTLQPGTGHGARLCLTQTGPRELAAQRFTALAAWEARIKQVAVAS